MANGKGLFGGGGRPRDLVMATVAGLVVVLGAYLAGWHDAAAFGLAVILILDLVIVIRGRAARMSASTSAEEETVMTQDWPNIPYRQALAAFEAGEKLYIGGRTFLVRQALREDEPGPVLWVTDEQTPGDHGLLLYSNGHFEAR